MENTFVTIGAYTICIEEIRVCVTREDGTCRVYLKGQDMFCDLTVEESVRFAMYWNEFSDIL